MDPANGPTAGTSVFAGYLVRPGLLTRSCRAADCRARLHAQPRAGPGRLRSSSGKAGPQTQQPADLGEHVNDEFIGVVDRDARSAQAAVRLVLAQPSIGSQLVDNLNASIHPSAV